MHKLYLPLHAMTRVVGAQNLHLIKKFKKVYWIIQIGFDSFPLKQKSNKNEHILFQKMYIQFQIGMLFPERIN